MATPYIVRTLTLATGERLPILLDKRNGIPQFAPLIYSLTQLRGRNLTSNTIEQGLRNILVFLIFLEQREINIEERLRVGKILDLAEIESLVITCKFKIKEILNPIQADKSKPARITSFANSRNSHLLIGQKQIDGNSAANRLRGILDYLNWLVKVQLLTFPADTSYFLKLDTSLQIVIEAIRARLPIRGNNNVLGSRMGLPSDISSRLLAVTSKNSPENPWLGEFTKSRNELIICWLYYLGLRRGELLNVKISDIDFRAQTVLIVRRADSPEDPRSKQPSVKTKDRLLPLSKSLCQLTLNFVKYIRPKWPNATKHGYLFVADKSGAPMSLSALNKCFAFLRAHIPDLPKDLSPHFMRHTWNDNFSKEMDDKKISDADEQQIRSFLMGWSTTSRTSVIYSKRHLLDKAKKVSLTLQTKLIEKDKP